MNDIYIHFPDKLREQLEETEGVEEIHICEDKRVAVYAKREILLDYRFNKKEISELVFSFSKHSLYAFLDELKKGYFTVTGGVRIGVAGRVVCENGKINLIKDFSSLSIRFPKNVRGIGKSALEITAGVDGNILIVSPPKQGKTTLLRDMIRELSDGGKKCAVIDERCEISGDMKFDLGKRTDVLLSCPKALGMSMAVRSLSPEIVATDEIGTEEDLVAIFEAINSGVNVITTAHGRSLKGLKERMFFRKLFDENVFRCVLLLSDKLGRSTLEQAYINGESVLKYPVMLKGEDI